MKKYLIFAASALALASCSSDDFLGENPGNVQNATTAINFGGEAGKTTRANKTGEDAANALNKKFVVYGYKQGSDAPVFDHYTISWNGYKGQTESNTQGWEYVGGTPNSLSSLSSLTAQQTIKYWDYSASQYDFVAFSFGKATQGDGTGANDVKATPVTKDPSYTLTGNVKDLADCFIADRVTAKPNIAAVDKKANLLVGYQDDVQFNFRSLATKVTMGIYEIVPGYSIKDVKFYKDATETAPTAGKPTLFADGNKIPSGNGTITVKFPETDKSKTDYNKAHVDFNANGTDDMSSTIAFDVLSLENKENAEENKNQYIGRDITTVSTPKEGTNKKYETVIPAHVGALTLKVDYTLVSIDGSGEEINVKGATAVVPEVYTKWEPNYAYTYIFKISDKTNGNTGDPTKPGLYPITFDAVVTETSEGLQETITTDKDPSITTYAKGAINNEYKKDANIYVSVNNATKQHINTGTEDTEKTNVKLYKAKGTGSYKNITEATVALCLSKGNETGTTEGEKKLTNGTGNDLTVTPASGLTIATEIAAADAVDGNAISGNFAKFTPTTAGTYVFEFTDNDANATKYYKVIKVVE